MLCMNAFILVLEFIIVIGKLNVFNYTVVKADHQLLVVHKLIRLANLVMVLLV